MSTVEQRARWLAASKRYRAKHATEPTYQERVKAHRHSDYLRHREARLKAVLDWGKTFAHIKVDREHKRKAMKFETEYQDCSAQIAILKLAKLCFWCGCDLTDKNRTIDHVVPLSRKGQHKRHNIVACCRSCNASKGKKLPEEWRAK